MNSHRFRQTGIIGALVLLLAFAGGVTARAIWQNSRPPASVVEIERWFDQGDWDRADVAVTQYLAKRPNHALALMLGARIAAAKSDLERSARLLEQVPEIAPQKIEALTHQGQTLLEAGYARRAEEAFREVLRRADPQNLSARPFQRTVLAELAALLHQEQRIDPAIALVWEMYPDHPEKWRLLINLLRMHGSPPHPRLSIPVIENYVNRDPGDLDARRALALYHSVELQWPEAIRQAQLCLERKPDDVRSLETLLQSYRAQQQWHDMDLIFARPELDPKSALVWRLMGERKQAAGDWQEAEQSFRQSLKLKPYESTTHYQLAFLLRLAGEDEEAVRHQELFQELKGHENWLEEFLKDFPQGATEGWRRPNPKTCIELSDRTRGLGRLPEARAWLEEALAQHPSSSEARAKLAEITAR